VAAAFYPEFENESAERQTRKEMAGEVEGGRGVVEASVKHSGSLFLWAGAQPGGLRQELIRKRVSSLTQ